MNSAAIFSTASTVNRQSTVGHQPPNKQEKKGFFSGFFGGSAADVDVATLCNIAM